MELIKRAGRSTVQNISSSNGELLSVACSYSEFPILLHPIFGSCHSQCPALSWVFICSFPDLVCTIYASLAMFHTPDLSSQNVWFLCYSTNFVQKMMWHYFWSGSVHCILLEIVPWNWVCKACEASGTSRGTKWLWWWCHLTIYGHVPDYIDR